MPPRPKEGISQQEYLLRLRAAIDTALNYPSEINRNTATGFAVRYPKALRSSHVRSNLGAKRWTWLNLHGVYPIGEATEINDQPAMKGTYTPELRT